MKFPSWLIPAILLIVTIDQWVAATGDADPYKLTAIPLFNIPLSPAFSITSMARGIGIMLAVSYGISGIHSLVTSKISWARVIGAILLGFVFLMLMVETIVITPYIVTSMSTTGIAKTLLETNIFGQGTGTIVYTGWALMVAIMPLLGVTISALAALSPIAQRQEQTQPEISQTPEVPEKSARKNRARNLAPPILDQLRQKQSIQE